MQTHSHIFFGGFCSLSLSLFLFWLLQSTDNVEKFFIHTTKTTMLMWSVKWFEIKRNEKKRKSMLDNKSTPKWGTKWKKKFTHAFVLATQRLYEKIFVRSFEKKERFFLYKRRTNNFRVCLIRCGYLGFYFSLQRLGV